MILALQVGLVVAVSGLVVFLAVYTRLTRGKAWRDPIGQTIILQDVLLIGELMPLLLAVFFHLSAFGSKVGGWILIASIFLTGVAMYWRTYVFNREKNRSDQ